MQRWTVSVTHTDSAEASTYPVTPAVQVAFERNFKTGIGKAFSEEQRIEHVYWLGWKAEHAAGVTVPLFDPWLETVAEIDINGGEIPFDESP